MKPPEPLSPGSSPSAGDRFGERRVLGPGLVVDEHGVALAERAPAGVLPGETDVVTVHEDAAESEGLAEGPVDLARRVELGALARAGGRAWGAR